MPMTGFEPQTSGIGSDHSTNWATTTAQIFQFIYDFAAGSSILDLPRWLPQYWTFERMGTKSPLVAVWFELAKLTSCRELESWQHLPGDMKRMGWLGRLAK